MTIFKTSKNLGKLRLEKVIFEANDPILFTCVNDSEQLFLCTHFQSDYKADKWLIKEVTPSTIIKLLQDEITIREAFLVDNKNRFTFSQIPNGALTEEKDVISDWHESTSISLPTADEYLEADEGEFDEIILYYKRIDLLRKLKETLNRSVSLKNKIETIHFETTLTFSMQEDTTPITFKAANSDNYNDYSIDAAVSDRALSA